MTEESKIHEHESLSFNAAYRAFENRLINLSYVEFGLLVFGGDIRIFEMRLNEDSELSQLSGRDQLSEVGIADSVSNEATPLESTLTRFRYAKTDVEELTPDYRYIPFDNACVEIAAFADKSKNEIKLHLINMENRKHICPHHPYYSFVQLEQDDLWLDSAYSEYEIDKILSDEFNISEYDIAFDVGVSLSELKDNGESADEIKRIKNILNRRISRHADLVTRQNAIAELMALRPSFRDANIDEYKKTSSDLVGGLIPLPMIPSLEDRSLRYVWLNILIQRKTFVDGCPPGSERTIELGQLNKTIDEITRQLECLGMDEVDNSKIITEAVAIADSSDESWQNDSSLMKCDKQLKAILSVITLKSFNPLAIPDGEKSGTLQIICETEYPLLFDGESSFDEAWKYGRKKNEIRMANHASFAKRSNM